MLEDCVDSCVPCGLHQPMRNNYFDGKFLVSRDFTGEQDYLRGHRQMHNAYLHGSGTVCGLKLIEHPAEQCRREFVVCEPGMALDCCGQEIIVPERALVRVRDLIEADEDLQASLDGKNHLFISIERCDAGAEPVPLILPTCDGPENTEFGRIAEGFRFSLSARSPAEVEPVEQPIEPSIEWVHSFTYDGGTPKALHVNDGEKLLQVAVDDPTGANTYAYDLPTHDLQAVLGGPLSASDTASGREARLLFVAGSAFAVPVGDPDAPEDEADDDTDVVVEQVVNGVGVWRANALDARPAGVIRTAGDRPRIAVSPLSGTLYVLDINGDKSRLVGYPRDNVGEWLDEGPGGPTSEAPLEGASMVFDHGFGESTDAAGRGAAMMEISRDGRFLALISPDGEPGERLYLIDTATFAGGDLEAAAARPATFSRPATERLEAIRWSYDDAYLYVLTSDLVDAGRLLLTRFELIDQTGDLQPAGSGVALQGTGYDLAVAPTDRRAYLLMADPDGVTRFTTVELDLVRSFEQEPPAVALPPGTIRLDGSGRCLCLTANGNRLYVAVVDAVDDAAPGDVAEPLQAERGIVAVIDVKETDCTLKFDRLIEGCTDCHGTCGGVVLGHIPGYVYVADQDGPRMRDADSAGDGDVPIDNLTYRPIVPSASVIKEVIECIVAQGVAEGPPGPRGDAGRDGGDGEDGADGADGADGLSITEVEVEMGAPGSDPSASTVENGDGLTLRLNIPAARDGEDGDDGDDGDDGEGIDDAAITYADPMADPSADIRTANGQRILDISIPWRDSSIPIVGISWRHDEPHPEANVLGEFADLMKERGIAVGFARPVEWRAFRNEQQAGPTRLVELQVPLTIGQGMSHWVTLSDVTLRPIKFDPGLVQDGFLEQWDVLDDPVDDQVVGFALTGEVPDLDNVDYFRVVFYASQASDGAGRRVDGSLPTDPSFGRVDTFRSGFFLRR